MRNLTFRQIEEGEKALETPPLTTGPSVVRQYLEQYEAAHAWKE
jgi:hypothetical protein